MTPELKAKELVEIFAESIKGIEYGNLLERDWKSAKQCALICCDEILNELVPSDFATEQHYKELHDYWKQTKQEIEQL